MIDIVSSGDVRLGRLISFVPPFASRDSKLADPTVSRQNRWSLLALRFIVFTGQPDLGIDASWRRDRGGNVGDRADGAVGCGTSKLRAGRVVHGTPFFAEKHTYSLETAIPVFDKFRLAVQDPGSDRRMDTEGTDRFEGNVA